MNITIYSTNVTEPQFQLQNLRYHSSCSSNLFLKDRFGANQLVEWVNLDQGVITCFKIKFLQFVLTIPIDIETFGDSITLTSAESVTNFGFFNLTDDVNGVVLTPGADVGLDYNTTFDTTVRRRYTGVTTVTGITNTGVVCRGVDFFSFLAGVELPEVIPSSVPTTAPSVSLGPTPNPLESACELRGRLHSGSDGFKWGTPLKSLLETSSSVFYNGLPCTSSNTTEELGATTNGGVNGQSAACHRQGTRMSPLPRHLPSVTVHRQRHP
jgi:hypothetical protein